MLYQDFFKLGIPTYTTNIYSAVPTTAVPQIPIAKQLPTQIGRIFGMSIYTDGVTPANAALISVANASNLYLTLKHGATNFFEDLRLSELMCVSATANQVPIARDTNYMSCNIPGDFDLSTSFYSNPTSIIAGTICLKLWYISTDTYYTLQRSGMVWNNAKKIQVPQQQPKQQ